MLLKKNRSQFHDSKVSPLQAFWICVITFFSFYDVYFFRNCQLSRNWNNIERLTVHMQLSSNGLVCWIWRSGMPNLSSILTMDSCWEALKLHIEQSWATFSSKQASSKPILSLDYSFLRKYQLSGQVVSGLQTQFRNGARCVGAWVVAVGYKESGPSDALSRRSRDAASIGLLWRVRNDCSVHRFYSTIPHSLSVIDQAARTTAEQCTVFILVRWGVCSVCRISISWSQRFS